MGPDGKAPGGNPEPKGQKREARIIRLVKSRPPEREAAPLPERPEREALTRAEAAVALMREARGFRDAGMRRNWLLIAQSQLLKSLNHLNADLERLSA